MDNLLIALAVAGSAVAGVAALVSVLWHLATLARVPSPPVGVPNDEQVAARRTTDRLDSITRSLRADLRQWERGRK